MLGQNFGAQIAPGLNKLGVIGFAIAGQCRYAASVVCCGRRNGHDISSGQGK
jgi:hypothetical protein